MKNQDKINAAEKILDYAKKQGFTEAFLSYETDNEDCYEDFSAIPDDYDEGDEVTVKIHLVLDEAVVFEVMPDSEIEFLDKAE